MRYLSILFTIICFFAVGIIEISEASIIVPSLNMSGNITSTYGISSCGNQIDIDVFKFDVPWYGSATVARYKNGLPFSVNSNSTVVLQAAIDVLATTPGRIDLSSDTFTLTGQLNIQNSNLTLAGSGTTTFSLTDATKDFIRIQSTTLGKYVNDTKILGINFDATVQKSQGAAINGSYVCRLLVKDCTMNRRERTSVTVWDGIYINNFYNILVDHCTINPRRYGIAMANGWDFWIGGGSWICNPTTTIIDNSVGIYVGGNCGGIQVEDSNISLLDFGFRSENDLTGTGNREIFLGHSWFDSCKTYCIYFGDASINASGTAQLVGCWASGAGVGQTNPASVSACGLAIGNDMTDVRFIVSSMNIFANKGHGMLIGSGYGNMLGCLVRNNGAGNTNVAHGVYFTQLNYAWQFNGNFFGSNTGYGIEFSTADYCPVVGNQFNGNTAGSYHGGGAHNTIDNNIVT